jgi:hypothetical protein
LQYAKWLYSVKLSSRRGNQCFFCFHLNAVCLAEMQHNKFYSFWIYRIYKKSNYNITLTICIQEFLNVTRQLNTITQSLKSSTIYLKQEYPMFKRNCQIYLRLFPGGLGRVHIVNYSLSRKLYVMSVTDRRLCCWEPCQICSLNSEVVSMMPM